MSFENMNGFFKPDPSDQPDDRFSKREEQTGNGINIRNKGFLSGLRGSGGLFKRIDAVDVVGCTVIGGGVITVICTWSSFMDALFVNVAFPLLQLLASVVGICAIVIVPLLPVISRIRGRRRSQGIGRWFRW